MKFFHLVSEYLRGKLGQGLTISRAVTGLIVIITLFAILQLPQFASFRRWLTPTGAGIIIVDAPQIYTRERLVNDRLREADWFEAELGVTQQGAADRAKFERQQESIRKEITSKLKLISRGTSQANQAASGQLASQIADAVSAATLADAPASLFEDMAEYRERIRNRLMSVQLDDRHDIDGNTLYRLNMNAILLGQGPGTAIINVGIAENADSNLLMRQYRQIYEDWRVSLNDQTQRVIRDRVFAFSRSGPQVFTPATGTIMSAGDAIIFREFGRFLTCAYLEQLLRANGHLAKDSPLTSQPRVEYLIESGDWACSASALPSNAADRLIRTFMESYRRRATYDGWRPYARSVEQAIRKVAGNRLKSNQAGSGTSRTSTTNDVGPDASDHGNSKGVGAAGAATKDPKAWLNEKFDVERDCKGKPSWSIEVDGVRVEILCPSEPEPDIDLPGFIALLERLDRITDRWPLDEFWKSKDIEWNELLFDEKLQQLAGLLNSCRNIDAGDSCSLDADSSTYDGSSTYSVEGNRGEVEVGDGGDKIPSYCWNGIGREFDQLDHCQWKAELKIEKWIGAYLHYRYTYYSGDRKIDSADFQRFRLSEIFTISMIGCEVDSCRPVFGSIAPEPGLDPVWNFKQALNQGALAFTYSVSPTVAVRRVVDASKEHKDTTFETSLDALVGAIDAHETSNSSTEAIRRRPTVLGFGDRGRSEDEKSSRILDGGALGRPRAAFGWLVKTNDASELHEARNIELSAVVSLPSWWTAVDVTVATCWVGDSIYDSVSWFYNRIFQNEIKGDLCEGPYSTRDIYVALPGSEVDVSQKLGVEVIKDPYLDYPIDQQGMVLEIGRRGRLILTGGRLWKSPVVTLGMQTATKITVLPDMKGIIAEFECVFQPPDQEAATGKRPPPLIVWTSEERTAATYVKLIPFSGPDSEMPCPDQSQKDFR